jgi:starch phosphorylase
VLPQYSGGLGILAGDHLKAASDLGVPWSGSGLLYHAGYFKQSLSREGWQLELVPVLRPRRAADLAAPRGERRARHDLRSRCRAVPSCWPRSGSAQVGRVPLLLLDSDVEGNPDHYRDVTDRLYGGTSEHRLRQEILLGIGWRPALRVHARITGASSPRSSTPTRATPASSAWSGIRELTVEERPGLDFDTALEVSAPARCSPPTRRCRPASTASRAS